jgi:hypothetical protein
MRGAVPRVMARFFVNLSGKEIRTAAGGQGVLGMACTEVAHPVTDKFVTSQRVGPRGKRLIRLVKPSCRAAVSVVATGEGCLRLRPIVGGRLGYTPAKKNDSRGIYGLVIGIWWVACHMIA